MTVDDIIKAALEELGVVPIGEAAAITTEFKAKGLAKINAMLQEWAVEGLKLHALTTNNVTLVSGTASYTIGASGDFNVRRPVELVDAVLTVSTGVFQRLKVFNALFRYRGYRTYSTAQPSEVYYDPAYTLGTMTFQPTPDAAYAVALHSLVSLTEFAATTETIGLPPEYENPLALNLAMRLMSSFGKSDALLEKNALRAEAALFTNNSKRLIRDGVRLDSALVGGSVWDITTGEWR